MLAEYVLDELSAAYSLGADVLQLAHDRVGDAVAADVLEDVARRRLAEPPQRLRRAQVRHRDLGRAVEQGVDQRQPDRLRRRAGRGVTDQPGRERGALQGVIDLRPQLVGLRGYGDLVQLLRGSDRRVRLCPERVDDGRVVVTAARQELAAVDAA